MNAQPARFHELAIQHVAQETPDSVVVTFAIPQDLQELFTFVPGQYVTLRTTIDEQDVRRSYSICSVPGTANLSVGIKWIQGGLFSGFAQQLKAGDRLSVMTPQGRFTATLGGRHNYLLLAAGSGVTPILSIAESVLSHEPESTITLFYANRNTQNVMFRQHFNDLKDKYLTRFLLTHVMDEESQDVELFNGRLDAEKLHSLQTGGLITPCDYDAIYICGPQPMIVTVSAALEELGVSPAVIKRELFTTTTPPRAASESSVNPNDERSKPVTSQVDVLLDGSTRTFSVSDEDTVLAAARKAGMDIPYSCANGMCATCRCRLTKGTATMEQNFSLDPWEIDEGFVLACQLRPTSPSIELDFDAV